MRAQVVTKHLEPHPAGEPANIAALISAARDGSQALESLMNLCATYVRSKVHASMDVQLRTKVRDSDIVQESLLDAFRAFKRFRGTTDCQLYAWLDQIVHRNLLNTREFFKAEFRDMERERLSLDAPGTDNKLGLVLASDAPSPGSEAHHHEQEETLLRAVRQLPDDYRQVILLHNWKAMSFTDLGLIMNRSEEAIRGLWSRALHQLEEVLRSSPGLLRASADNDPSEGQE